MFQTKCTVAASRFVLDSENYEPTPARIADILDPGADLTESLRTIASMFWRGMDEVFWEVIGRPPAVSRTVKNWVHAYLEAIKPTSTEVRMPPKPPPGVSFPKIVEPVQMSKHFYIEFTPENTATTETGIYCTPETYETVRPRRTAEYLRNFTSARLTNLPVLKDLGVLQLIRISGDKNNNLVCWLREDDDPDTELTRYLLREHPAPQNARQEAELENAIYEVLPGSTFASTVICLHDLIVKVTPLIYTKKKKTYYTLSQMPVPCIQILEVPPDRMEIRHMAMARFIFGSSCKTHPFASTANGLEHVCVNHSKPFQDNAGAHARQFFRVDSTDKKWLQSLRNNEKINSDVRSRSRLDQLLSEFL